MDPATTRDDAAARNRFESFKLGKGLPSNGPNAVPKHAHTRSHSRNTSISFPPAKPTTVNDFSHFSFPASASTPNGLSPTINLSPSPSPTSLTYPNLNPPSKRNSHHRRRSSVSTRHESAEMMGVALPDLPASTSDDNINLGEKDSIRRRALWALEGKPDVSFSKVEIPDISTPDVEKMLFDFATKPSSTSSYSNGLTISKRDSFKLLGASSSSKDQLGTLLEEEEEEDESAECSKEEVSVLPSPTNSIKENLPPTPVLAVTKATPSKPRPSNLNLRPLSLTPDNLHITPSLPSPSLTPSSRGALRSLSLTPSSSIDSNENDSKQSRRASLITSRRPVLNLALEQLEKSTSEDDTKTSRRSSISYKRSHGGVTTNSAGLPTPEMTPTFGRRYSSASAGDRESISSFGFGSGNPGSAQSIAADDDFFPGPPTQARPLSASEQHFLFKSHNALLARITDLERALSMRRRESGGAYSNGGNSRPASAASNFSSGSSSISPSQSHSTNASLSEPSDEMLCLIADLKAERDELKRDVDGWRTRVSDMESQISVLAKRVENERRDAWVARSRMGLLEVEKGVLSKKLEGLEELTTLRQQQDTLLKAYWEAERRKLVAKEEESKRRVVVVEKELERVRKELEVERLMKKALIQQHAKEEIDPLATPTPRSFDVYTRPSMASVAVKKHGLGFVDSETSVTDVDSSDDGFRLKAVREESESEHDENSYSEDLYSEEEENGLAGYEDEEDTDTSLQSSSSFGSDENLPRSLTHLHQQQNDNTVGLPPSPTTPKLQVFTPPKSHARRSTLSKTWTFPFGAQHQSAASPFGSQNKAAGADEEVDKFFGCLEDGESDTTGSMPSSPSAYSYENSKSAFASGFKFASSDDNASFFLPGVGFPGSDDVHEHVREEQQGLAVVAEETEDEEESSLDMEESDSEVDDGDMFGDIGGIRITFTPPQDDEVKEVERAQIQVCSPVKRTSPPPMLPALDFGLGDEDEQEEEDDDTSVIPISFGRSLMDERQPSPPPVAVPVQSSTPVAFPTIVTPPSSLPRPSSPSMIPRPSSPSTFSIPRAIPFTRSTVSSVSNTASTPTKVTPLRAAPASISASFVTPPTKRGGATPSFIPQHISSPIRTAPTMSARTSKAAIPTSTFIRQPTRKPLLPTTNAKPRSTATSGNANGSALILQPPVILSSVKAPMNMRPSASFRRSSVDRAADPSPATAALYNYNYNVFGGDGECNTSASSAQMKSVDLSHDHTFSISSSSSTGSSSSNTAISDPSSVLTSPLSFSATRLSFQTITNFIPMSWSSSSLPHSTPSHSATSSISEHTVVPDHPSPRIVSSLLPTIKQATGGYVSREKQLKKLRARMEVEGIVPMSYSANVQCRNCNGELVFI